MHLSIYCIGKVNPELDHVISPLLSFLAQFPFKVIYRCSDMVTFFKIGELNHFFSVLEDSYTIFEAFVSIFYVPFNTSDFV